MLAGLRFSLKKIFLLCLCLLNLGFIFLVESDSASAETFLSPLAESSFQDPPVKKTQVIGFLPYWNINKEFKLDFSVLDQLIYFGVTVAEDGSLQTMQEGEAEPGWLKLTSGEAANILQEAKQKHKKVLLTLISFDADITDALITDDERKQKLINEITTLVKDYDFDGVDVDFEYFPEDDNLADFGSRFNQFLQELKVALKKENRAAILSVDIYPKALIYGWPYQLPELGKIADQIVIMAYDYTQSNSPFAGPVAPMKGQNEKEMSIVKTMQAALGKIDKGKLILGMPLYGYEWRTVSQEPRSRAYWGSGEMTSYAQVQELIKEKNLTVNWDEVAYSPWLTYRDGWRIKEIYFDDLKSLNSKIELAQQLSLQGIAFWALGYEGNHTEIWDLLKKKL